MRNSVIRNSIMRNSALRNNNKGFSLVEIIIAIAILALLATGTVTAIGQIGLANITKAAKSIDVLMEKVRMETMSKEQKKYLHLYSIEGSIYMKVNTVETAETIENVKATGKEIAKNSLLYVDSDVTYLDDGDSISISFERSSGAFSSDYEYIKIQNSNNTKTAVIYMIKETGRHWVE